MIEIHCDFCGQIINSQQRYYGLETKGPLSVFEPKFDVCPDCFNALKNFKENKNSNV